MLAHCRLPRRLSGLRILPHDRPPNRMAEYALVHRMVEETGSLHGAQRVLYKGDGGKRYYWLRAGEARYCKAHGLPYQEGHLAIPVKYL